MLVPGWVTVSWCCSSNNYYVGLLATSLTPRNSYAWHNLYIYGCVVQTLDQSMDPSSSHVKLIELKELDELDEWVEFDVGLNG